MNEMFRMDNNIIPAKNYPEAKKAFERIRSKYNDKIILTRN